MNDTIITTPQGTTRIFKKLRDGWNADTTISMGQVPATELTKAGERVLTINTSKASRGGVRTSASVSLHADGFMQHVFSYGDEGDYSKTIATDPTAKCTEKAVRAQHGSALNGASAILADAAAFYAAKEAKRLAQLERAGERERALIERAPADEARDEGQVTL